MIRRRKKHDNISPQEDAEQTIASDESENTAAISDEMTEAETEEEPVPDTIGTKIKRILVKTLILVLFLFVLLVGLCVMLYPAISDFVNNKNQSRVIDGYKTTLHEISEVDYTAYIDAARSYNARLAGNHETIQDAFNAIPADKKEDEYWGLLDVSRNGMMGYVEIEILDIKIPLYHGTSEIVLAKGAGHIQGTSLPIGGESTHAVVSAHTGLPSAKLFTGVDKLKNGDTFTLYILNEMLTYQVDQVMTVLPHEVDELRIIENGDYVTLVTCTPYGINSHRLFIRGTRIENPPEKQNEMLDSVVQDDETLSWTQRAYDNVVRVLSTAVEEVAVKIVSLSEWVMNKIGVEY